jgi:hypothetical protein
VAAAQADVGRCPDALPALCAAVEATMDDHGGLVPRDVLIDAVIRAGVPLVAVLRIVWALTKVRRVDWQQGFACVGFCQRVVDVRVLQKEGALEAAPAAAITSAMIALSFSSFVVEWVATAAVKRKLFTLPVDAVGGMLADIGMSSAGAGRVVTYLRWVRPVMAWHHRRPGSLCLRPLCGLQYLYPTRRCHRPLRVPCGWRTALPRGAPSRHVQQSSH